MIFKIKIETHLDNIILKDNDIQFIKNDGELTYKPYNKYIFDSDSYNTVQKYLYSPDYLNFTYTSNIYDFKNECIKHLLNNKYTFNYKNLFVRIEEVKQ